VPEELSKLVQAAYRTRRARARLILDDCLARLPHYRQLPEPLMAEVRQSILHHLAVLYRITLQTGRALTDQDLEYSRQTARRRAAQGVPLGDFLTFFLVGLTRAWEHLIAEAGDDPQLRDRLLERVSAVISNQTQLMTALTEAYVEERERRSRFREQDLDDFFQLLLAEEAVPNLLEARAAALGIGLDEPRAIAIFGPPGAGPAIAPEDLRRRLAARLLGADVWVGRSRDGFVALLPDAPDPKALGAAADGLLGGEVRVGVGRSGSDIDGLRRSAHEALRALRIGVGLPGGQRVFLYEAVAILDLIGVDSSRAEEFMRSALGPLAAADAPRIYLETLRQLCAHNHSLKLAAAALSVHPHTLSYRLRQMRRRFGVDLHDAEQRLRVQLALLILDARAPAAQRVTRAGTP
jgi:sugar diacid utilization regulator